MNLTYQPDTNRYAIIDNNYMTVVTFPVGQFPTVKQYQYPASDLDIQRCADAKREFDALLDSLERINPIETPKPQTQEDRDEDVIQMCLDNISDAGVLELVN